MAFVFFSEEFRELLFVTEEATDLSSKVYSGL